ncbi:hypothetical protein LCGC14_0816570 [marine sediment metagenome]|uniref:Uncharacterized protein n=1 Tax=marine sediment metagenome TaxID=412755 RepID=A0A0F9PJY4_9ZZZZ
MGAVAPERLIQLGVETVRGTEVAATARLIPRPGEVTWRDNTEKPPLEADWGTLDRRHSAHPSQVARQLTEMEMTADCSFEQILYPLLAGVQGGVTPVAQAAGVDGHLWTFTPFPTADPVPDAFTLEYVEREGITNKMQVTATYGLVKRIRITSSPGAEYATLETEWFARNGVSQAPTADPGLPTKNVTPGPKWRIATAANFAALESAPSLLQAQVMGFEWELVTGILPKFRLDDDSPDFAAYQFGARECSLKLTLDLTAEAETERTARLQAAGIQYLRADVVGPVIGSDNHKIKIDGAYELTNPIEAGNDDEDQSQVELEYTAIHDSTKGAAFEIVVHNNLATLP